MDFHCGDGHCFDRIQQRDTGVGIGCWIDDDAIYMVK